MEGGSSLGIHREVWTTSLHTALPTLRGHQASAGSGWHCWAGQVEQIPQKLSPTTSSMASDRIPGACTGNESVHHTGHGNWCQPTGMDPHGEAGSGQRDIQPQHGHNGTVFPLGTQRSKPEGDSVPAPRVSGQDCAAAELEAGWASEAGQSGKRSGRSQPHRGTETP